MKQQTFPLVKRWLLLLDFTTNSLPPWNVKLYLISYQYDRKWQHSLEQHHRLCIWHLQCYVWEHNSVVSRLKEKIPSIFVMHCICHTAHLCASHACEKLPWTVEELMHDVYNYFCHSAKHQDEFRVVQYFSDVEPHKLLRPCQTRWLSLYSYVCIKAHWAMGWTHKVLSSCS